MCHFGDSSGYLINEGVSVAALFDLHRNGQEWQVNERSKHLYIGPVKFFIVRLTTATQCEHQFHSKLEECFRVWSLFFGCLVFAFSQSWRELLILGQTKLVSCLLTFIWMLKSPIGINLCGSRSFSQSSMQFF